MTCNTCNLNKELYLYTKDNLIYSLCDRCLKTQEQIDEVNRYQKLMDNMHRGFDYLQ